MPHSIGLVADPIDFVNEDVAEPRPLKVVPSLCFGRGLGSNAGDMKINRLMVVDRERGIAFHKPFAIAATADSTLLDILDKGKGHGDPSADAVEGREGREVCFLGRPALRVRRRRLWSTVGMPARAASGAEPQPRQDCRYYDAPGSGADLSSAATAIRHTQIPGFQEGRFSQADPGRHVRLLHHLAATCWRPMPITIRLPSGRTKRVYPRGLSRRDHDHGAMKGRQCDLI